MNARVWVANVLGWPLIHLAIGSLAVKLPASLFARDTWLTAPRRWERDGCLYRDVLAIRRWKPLLPDGAPWLGGSKKELRGRDRRGLTRFLVETRRAEWSHWCMLGCLPVFFLWNPPWASLVITAYAVAANLPCILAQRYNRITLGRVLRSVQRGPQS